MTCVVNAEQCNIKLCYDLCKPPAAQHVLFKQDVKLIIFPVRSFTTYIDKV